MQIEGGYRCHRRYGGPPELTVTVSEEPAFPVYIISVTIGLITDEMSSLAKLVEGGNTTRDLLRCAQSEGCIMFLSFSYLINANALGGMWNVCRFLNNVDRSFNCLSSENLCRN